MSSTIIRYFKFIPVLFFSFLAFIPAGIAKTNDEGSMIDTIRQIEQNEIHRDILSPDYFGYQKGRIPVLISAPHGAKHFRTKENRWKAEDAYTSAIAIQLGRMTGAHVLYLRNKAPEDPNNDTGTRYKDFLAGIARENGIKFIIDLHGAGAERPFKVDVGVIDNKIAGSSCPKLHRTIEHAFRDFENKPFNHHFMAKGPGTITYFAKHTLGIEAAQIEINARYRMINDSADEQNIRDLMHCLQALIIKANQKVQCSKLRVQSSPKI